MSVNFHFSWAGLFESRLTLTQDSTLSAEIFFLVQKCFSPLTFSVVWNYYSIKLHGKQYKENTSPKNYKTEIKILANPGLA